MGHLEDPRLTTDLDHGARLRSRHQRSAVVDLDGLHRLRAGGAGGRSRVGAGAGGVRLVGADAAGWGLDRHALAAARERDLAGSQHATKFARRSGTPITPIAWRWIRRLPRNCGCSAWPVGRWNGSRRGAGSCWICNGRRRVCGSGRCCGACCWCCRRTCWCSGRSPTTRGRAPGAVARLVTFVSAAVGTSMIAFGGLSWALDGAAAPAAAVLRLREAMGGGRAVARHRTRRRDAGARNPVPQRDASLIRRSSAACAGRLRSDHSRGFLAGDRRPKRRRENHAGEAVVPPVRSAGGRDRNRWGRSARARHRCMAARVTAVFQDFIRFELPLRDNVSPAGAPDSVIQAALDGSRRGASGEPRHDPGARLRRWHRSFRRPVAADRAGARTVRRENGRGRGACWMNPPRNSTCAAKRKYSSAF